MSMPGTHSPARGTARRQPIRRARSFVAIAVAIYLVAFSGAQGRADDKPSIKVGAVSTLSGPATFAESSDTAKAYFDRVNAQGGIGGRKIEYVIVDDKFDPAASAQAGHRLVEDDNVVANVGGASIFDCTVNGSYYLKSGMISVPGVGIDPQCFNTPNISPVNTGPYVAFANLAYYAAAHFKADKICGVIDEGASLAPGYKKIMPQLEAAMHTKMLYVDYSHHAADDPIPYILKAKSAGCQAVISTGVEPGDIAWMKAVRAQGLLTTIKWMFIGAPYTIGVANALGASANGILVASEFEPWSGNSAVLDDWRTLVSTTKIAPAAFSQGGYISAKIFVDTLRSIKGEIDRASVTAAFKRLTPVKTAFMGSPYTFGPAAAHNPNQSVKIMTLVDGKWKAFDPAWVTLPGAHS